MVSLRKSAVRRSSSEANIFSVMCHRVSCCEQRHGVEGLAGRKCGRNGLSRHKMGAMIARREELSAPSGLEGQTTRSFRWFHARGVRSPHCSYPRQKCHTSLLRIMRSYPAFTSSISASHSRQKMSPSKTGTGESPTFKVRPTDWVLQSHISGSRQAKTWLSSSPTRPHSRSNSARSQTPTSPVVQRYLSSSPPTPRRSRKTHRTS